MSNNGDARRYRGQYVPIPARPFEVIVMATPNQYSQHSNVVNPGQIVRPSLPQACRFNGGLKSNHFNSTQQRPKPKVRQRV